MQGIGYSTYLYSLCYSKCTYSMDNDVKLVSSHKDRYFNEISHFVYYTCIVRTLYYLVCIVSNGISVLKICLNFIQKKIIKCNFIFLDDFVIYRIEARAC